MLEGVVTNVARTCDPTPLLLSVAINYAYLNYVVHPISHGLAEIVRVTAL